MLVAPEVALGRGLADVLEVSLWTYTRTLASPNPEPAQEQKEDIGRTCVLSPLSQVGSLGCRRRTDIHPQQRVGAPQTP